MNTKKQISKNWKAGMKIRKPADAFVWWDGLPKRTADQRILCGEKYFYYRCRQLSAQEQMQKMGEEIQNAFQMKLSRYSYDEFLTG